MYAIRSYYAVKSILYSEKSPMVPMGGDGILDIVQGLTEDALSKYDDGTNSKFVVNGDGLV